MDKNRYVPNDGDWNNVFRLRTAELIKINNKENGEFLYRENK